MLNEMIAYDLYDQNRVNVRVNDLDMFKSTLKKVDHVVEQEQQSDLRSSLEIYTISSIDILLKEGFSFEDLGQIDSVSLNSVRSLYLYGTFRMQSFFEDNLEHSVAFFNSAFIVFRALDFEKSRTDKDQNYLEDLTVVRNAIVTVYQNQQLIN